MVGALTPGAQVGRYVLEREVGRGGMGIVYRAVDPALNRTVALKLLGPAFGNEQTARRRFHREAASVAPLKHPHIALVYEFGEHDGQPFIVLEWAEGRTLRDLLNDGPLPLERVLRLFDQLAAALDYAHSRGVIHRDLKPANVIIGPDDHVTIVDFGLAQLTSTPAITVSGALFGTPRYVAPEQVRGEELDGRADQYSLAVMIYEALTGRLPFEGDTTPSLLHHHLYTPPIPITEHQPALPVQVEAALQRALSKQPAARFATLAEFGAALRGETVALASALKHGRSGLADVARRWAALLGITVTVLGVMGLLAAFALNNFNSFNSVAQATLTARLAETQSAEKTFAAAAPTRLPTVTEPPTEEPTPEPTPAATLLPTPIPTPVNNPPAEDGWWPMVSGDSLYSGRVWSGFPTLNPQPVWSRPPLGELGGRTAMVAGGGFVFFATNGGFVRALDWTTGLPQPGWRTQLEAEVIGEPVLYGDESNFRLLVALESNGLAGLEAATGERVWQRSVEELNGSVNALTLADGHVYAATGNGWLNVINPVTGETFGFDLSATDGFHGAPAVSEGIVYLTGYRQTVYAVSVESGQVLWAGEVRGNPSTPPSVSPGSGRLFVGTEEGFVHALWLTSGNPAWPPTRASSRIAGLAYDEARVYAVAEEGQVYAWWIETGELAWAVNLGAPLYAAPLTDGNLLAVVTPYVEGKSNGDVRFLRVSDGGEETSLRLTTYDGGYHPPAFAGGWLFVPGWAMYAFGPP